MISCADLFKIFKKNDITFFTGVPDSTFKDWLNFLFDEQDLNLKNIIACNECEAIALAAGYNLATKKIACVYLQNSGEGKTVNPLTSLCDREVYSIPLLMIIGWRGEPGKEDEPQHKKMGRITTSLLDVLEVPYLIMSETLSEVESEINKLVLLSLKESRPVAMIIKSNCLENYIYKKRVESEFELSREEAIQIIVDNLKGDEAIVSTTGKTSRELFEYRIKKGEVPRDFYTVGSMGCSSSIANAIALNSNRKIIILDGDGAALMQLGAITTIGHYKPENLIHIILDNGSYESTGGKPTVSSTVDFEKIALSCGYKSTLTIKTRNEFSGLGLILTTSGPSMIVVKVNEKSRKDLSRPTKTPLQNKEGFMDFLNGSN